MTDQTYRPQFPLAMDVPQGDVVKVTQTMVNEAAAMSRESPRKRIILPFHASDANVLHRMFNVVQKGTYIRAHRHRTPPKDETLVVLQGGIQVFIFDDAGQIAQTFPVKAGTDVFGVDIKAGICHTFAVMENDTVVFEVKPGPYNPKTDKDFASWAPEEGTSEAAEYLADLYKHVGL
ncbi:MAG: WbuC family cupin fold metalloprotein [Phycisphaeraceae bacterium]|nr:WbuC family cupin fold metalloprotein [Phycisphaeraceae bacterium]